MSVEYTQILNAIKDAKDLNSWFIIIAAFVIAVVQVILTLILKSFFETRLTNISHSLSVLVETYKPAAKHKYEILTVLWIRVKDVVFTFTFPYDDQSQAIIDSDEVLQEYRMKMHEAFEGLYKDCVFFPATTFKKYETIFLDIDRLLVAKPIDKAGIEAQMEELTRLVRADLGIDFTDNQSRAS
jgi:hypothetical protein